MKFHTVFDIKKITQPIEHRHQLLLIGSCFTESIGEKLRKHKFTTLENPNGILFNPVSVAEAIAGYIENKSVTEKDIFQYNETWHSWKHHSRFSGITIEDCIGKINQATNAAHEFLKTAHCLMVTLGSAWVYTLTENALNGPVGSIAANNHKAPANWFDKRLMRIEETQSVLTNMLESLLAFNPKLQVIFTISPVRHLREGMIENNRSKAVLIQVVHELAAKWNQLYYFPAYELVIDDLRDYRFYAEDLVHPNYQATQYVWENFIEACTTDATRELIKEIADINLAYQHKPFNALTRQHRQFLLAYKERTNAIQLKYPYLDFKNELAYFAHEVL